MAAVADTDQQARRRQAIGSRASPSAGPMGTRVAAVIALLAGAVTVAVLLSAGGSYSIQAHFVDAGGLVDGAQVRVAGVTVGTVTGIGLTQNSQADITISITDHQYIPLHRLTRASIRAVGQAGVTNHYVELTPGPRTEPVLPSGAVLPTSLTTGYVSLDAILDSLDPATRASIDQFVSRSSQLYAGSGSTYFNSMLGKLSPALGAVAGLSGQLASDRADLGRLISTADRAASAIASRDPELRAAVSNTAVSLGALARQRAALADSLTRAPAVLGRVRMTLALGRRAIDALRPALREVPPAATPLGAVLHALPPSLASTTPTIAQLRSELPGLTRSLLGFVPLRDPAVAALGSLGTALERSMPILAGLRVYAPDLLIGLFNGLIGISTGPYDYSGHYIHAEYVQSPQFLLRGIASGLFSSHALVPGLLALRTNLTARCPGADEPPAPDGSNPWVPDKSLCNPADNVPSSVNQP
jgi:phospholipid/cholesterol/gamma-HCH transport system substrate-binding protein